MQSGHLSVKNPQTSNNWYTSKTTTLLLEWNKHHVYFYKVTPLNSTLKRRIKSTPHLRVFTMAIALNNLRAMLARDLPCDFRYIINLWHTEVIHNSYSRSTELEDYLLQKTLLLLHLKIRHDYPKALFSIVKVNFLIFLTPTKQTSTFLKSFLRPSNMDSLEHLITTVAWTVVFCPNWEQHSWK